MHEPILPDSKKSMFLLVGFNCITGVLHIQVLYTAEVGHAFVINSRLPLKKWVQIVISVDDTNVYMTTRQFNGHVLEREANAVHTE